MYNLECLILNFNTMLFRNAFVYRLVEDFTLSIEQLLPKIQGQEFVPTSGIRGSSFGWMPLKGNEGPLVLEVDGRYLMNGKREEKVIPLGAINDLVLEKIEHRKSLEHGALSNSERRRIKEEATIDLLPRALPKSREILGYISPIDSFLIINTPHSSDAELFINCLRDSLGSLLVVPPQLKENPSKYFTQWLLNRNLPENIALGDQCDLKDIENGATVTCRHQDLSAREIRNHIESGKICTKIGLIWEGQLQATVDTDLVLRQLSMGTRENSEEDPESQFDTALAETALTLSRFIPELIRALGGETATN